MYLDLQEVQEIIDKNKWIPINEGEELVSCYHCWNSGSYLTHGAIKHQNCDVCKNERYLYRKHEISDMVCGKKGIFYNYRKVNQCKKKEK